jgi:microcystin-dependent protein
MASSEPLIGSIAMFAGNFAPRGYALCQGQLLSIAQNTALFSILGTTYGGNGQTTFGLPDLRGRFPVGQGQGPGLPNIDLGELAGSSSVTLTSNQMPMHNHLIACDGNASSQPSPANAFPGFGGDAITPTNIYSAGPANATMNPQAVSPAGGGQPVNVTNPFLGINFIIATEGIFPSRN